MGSPTQVFKQICALERDMWVDGLQDFYNTVNWKCEYDTPDQIEDASLRLVQFMTSPCHVNAQKKINQMVTHYVNVLGFSPKKATYIVVTRQMGCDTPQIPVNHLAHLPTIPMSVECCQALAEEQPPLHMTPQAGVQDLPLVEEGSIAAELATVEDKPVLNLEVES